MESVSVSNIRRDNMKISLCKECKETGARSARSSARNLTLCEGLVQGVHRSKIRLSIEESGKDDARKARGISV